MDRKPGRRGGMERPYASCCRRTSEQRRSISLSMRETRSISRMSDSRVAFSSARSARQWATRRRNPKSVSGTVRGASRVKRTVVQRWAWKTPGAAKADAAACRVRRGMRRRASRTNRVGRSIEPTRVRQVASASNSTNPSSCHVPHWATRLGQVWVGSLDRMAHPEARTRGSKQERSSDHSPARRSIDSSRSRNAKSSGITEVLT